jgi:hypothetical protein
MRTFLILGLLVIATVSLGCSRQGRQSADWAAPDRAETIDGKITETKLTPIQTLLANPEAYVGKTLLVEGEVTGRCQGSGCWVSLDTGDPENPFYVKSPDHSFSFPASCEQKRVRVQGILAVLQHKSTAQEEHEEHEEHDEHGEGHTCPAPLYYLEPQAAVAQK